MFCLGLKIKSWKTERIRLRGRESQIRRAVTLWQRSQLFCQIDHITIHTNKVQTSIDALQTVKKFTANRKQHLYLWIIHIIYIYTYVYVCLTFKWKFNSVSLFSSIYLLIELLKDYFAHLTFHTSNVSNAKLSKINHFKLFFDPLEVYVPCSRNGNLSSGLQCCYIVV